MTKEQAEAYILFKMLDMRPEEWWNYVAVDERGAVYVYEKYPIIRGSLWDSEGIGRQIFDMPEYISCWDCLVLKLA